MNTKTIVKYLSVFITILAISCQNNHDHIKNITFTDKLIYIEDIDGKDGLGMGDFGDIVIIDPIKKKKYYLTKDQFINLSPSLNASKSKLIFESKRDNKLHKFGTVSPSGLYYMNLNNFRIKKLNLKLNVADEYYSPVLNNNGSKIAFRIDETYKSSNLLIYDINSDSIDVIKKNIKNINSIDWCKDDRFISYGFKIRKNKFSDHYCIGIIDMVEGFTVDISDTNWVYNNGNISEKGLIIYSGLNKKDRITRIFSYNLSTHNTRILFSSNKDFFIHNPQMINDSTIYFLGSEFKNDNQRKVDIWELNLISNNLKQITRDGYSKIDLRYIEKSL